MDATDIHNRVRGLAAGPGAWFELEASGRPLRVKLLKTAPGDPGASGAPGRILVVEPDGAVLVQCGSGSLRVREVQPEGKKKLPAADFMNGLRLKAGQVLQGAASGPSAPPSA